MAVLMGFMGALAFALGAGLIFGVVHATSRPSSPPPSEASEETRATTNRAGTFLIIGAVILVLLGLVWLGRPRMLTPLPTDPEPVATYKHEFEHEFEVKIDPGPWRKVKEVDWTKVQSSFTIPAQGRLLCDQAKNAGKRLHYAIRQPDGTIVEMKPLEERASRDKQEEVTAPVGSVVQVTSLTGEELLLLVRY